MKIIAKCRFDKESVKALSRLSVYKKHNPRKTLMLRTGLWLILLAVILAGYIVFGYDFVPLALVAVGVVAIAIDCFMYFILPEISFKALGKMKDTENEYIFCDNALKAFSRNEEYNGEAEIEYSLFVKVYETSKYFFLYQSKNQVFIVDKSTVEGGSAEDIRSILTSFVKDKYIVCKY